MKSPVLLFDIDGTLLSVDRNHTREIIARSFSEIEDLMPYINKMNFAGRTDRDIFSEILDQLSCISPGELSFDHLKKAYIEVLTDSLEETFIHVHFQVDETLNWVRERNIICGLLTGNFEEAAHIKLSRAGIRHFFEWGVFGDHHADRNRLPEEAWNHLQKNEHQGSPEELIVIGDTPRDIDCAKAFGARSVAVSTGGYSREMLQSHQPDIVIDHLGELPELIDSWLS